MKSVVFLIHKGRRGWALGWLGQAVLAGQGWAGPARAGPGPAGRAGPGRHRLELDLGSILGGQAGGRFGSHFRRPQSPVVIVFNAQKLGPFTGLVWALIGLGLGSDWAWIGL